jgi:uroporphyrinogen-III synthase
MKSVLLTRAKEFNEQLQGRLRQLDYEVLECDLIEYDLQPLNLSEFITYDHLLITSFFAASKLPDAPRSNMTVWVVGMKSAKLLASKGYKVGFYAESAESLRRNIPESIFTDMLYLSSDYITVSMPPAIKRQIFYKVKYRASLSDSQIARYKQGLDYILLYSENCAKTLIKLLLENDLLNSLENTTFLVISSKVENIVKSHFVNIEICGGNDLMLEYLEKQLVCQ